MRLADAVAAQPKRRDLEGRLQKAVIEYLDLALSDNAMAFSIPNEGARGKRATARLVGMGLRKDMPDLAILSAGKLLFIELKPPGRSAREGQRNMHWKLATCGFTTVVCHSLDEVQYALEMSNIPLRARLT